MDTSLPNQNTTTQPSLVTNQPITPPPPSNTKKTFLILVAIFFLLLTGVAAYLMLWQKPASQPVVKTAPTPSSPTPTVNPIANWLTYSNPSLGFSFLYPKELAYSYDQLGDLISKKSTQGLLLLQDYDGSKPPPSENTLQVIVEITRSQTLSLDQYVKNGSTASGSATQTTVAGYPALTFITTQKGQQITNTAFKYIDLIYNTSINSIEKEKITLLNNIIATFALSASPSAKITP